MLIPLIQKEIIHLVIKMKKTLRDFLKSEILGKKNGPEDQNQRKKGQFIFFPIKKIFNG